MSQRASRSIVAMLAFAVGLATILVAAGRDGVPATAATTLADAPFQVVLQTMDSCKSALNGAAYTLSNDQGYSATAGTQGASTPGGVGPSPSCPLQQGNCVSTTRGCLTFTNVPPGDYRLRQTAEPAGNPSNPAGYAPCEGGSACQWEQADVTVAVDGSVGGVVTNVYPNGSTVTWPSFAGHKGYYAGTVADPIVFHDFGLAQPAAVPAPGTVGTGNRQCDGDSDADDYSTGTPSSECQFPEAQEASVCPNSPAPHFPWNCLAGPTRVAHLNIVNRNTGFILDLYHDVLGRTRQPAPTEVAYWLQQLIGGMSRADMARSFVASTEAHARIVTADYQLMLLRTPDAGGLSYWTAQLDRGVFNESILGQFGGSAEYYASPKKGAGNDATFVRSLYRDVLGRTPAPDEVAYWTGRIASGTPRSSMGNNFAFSHEYHLNLVNSWYPKYLGRTSDPNGAEFWAEYLDAGHADDIGIISILALEEYFEKTPAF
ncbi:MAG TPA: DUF4214 domain-containing protein [Candidatus Dormibacteraeota bacterium]|nr:DUF4214 domain-containing protein [Candidatus Dormibacteraeota bacterium]